MDYSRYMVDPWKGADWGRAERIGAQRQSMGLANRQQALAERKMGLQERAFQSGEQERELSMKERKQNIEDKRRKMLIHQLEFISNGLDAVDSQEGLETFGNIVKQLESAGAIDPAITSQGRIEQYDEKKVGQIKKQLKAILGKLKSGDYGKPYINPETGALLQTGPSGKTEKISGPAKYEKITTIDKDGNTHIRSIKAGETLDLPEGEMTLDQYEKDKESESKSTSRSNMSKEIDEIMGTEQITRKEALKKWQASRSYPQRIKLYNDTVRQIMDDIALTPEQQTQQMEEARKEFLPEHIKETKEIELPETIKKISEAISYLVEDHDMTEDEAKAWIKERM